MNALDTNVLRVAAVDIDNQACSAHQPAGQFEEERIVAPCGDERQAERATVELRQRQ